MKNSIKEDLAPYLFHQGTNYMAYKYLGAHKNGDGYVFRVWAPKAESVELVGDFNNWEPCSKMERVTENGVWEYTLAADGIEGMRYKYRITGANGVHLKADPYAFYNETLGKTASIIHTTEAFDWTDGVWLDKRSSIASGEHFYEAPLNIYEMQLASWQTEGGRTNKYGDAYLNYREIADRLAPYVKRMGYTHVELLPVTEYPYDGSWGYQVTGYFSPTSRFGTPEDFKYFVNKLHSNGIGVILDWVPAHFPKDEHGLFEFDGGDLYEYGSPDRKENKGWGTRYFDVGRNEVESFLISSAMYWIGEYHIDGLRVDAVASMLYLDYAKAPGEWAPNVNGGNENLESVAFLKKLNTVLFEYYPDILMIAEESTAWPQVTGRVCDGGLGFNFKWNMGWANDMFDYVQIDPYFRQYHHNKLTFSLMYAFSENYILPVSHDEVVHGKRSLLDKMYGEYEQKFAGDRIFMTYQMTHPGKKLTFMGCEYGQFREWDYENQLEWFMTDYEMHGKLRYFVEVLNNLYLERPELWQDDFSWKGFEWIFAERNEDNLIAFKRRDRSGNELIVVINFSAADRKNYQIPVEGGEYSLLLNSDKKEFGGSGKLNKRIYRAFTEKNKVEKSVLKQNFIKINIPALTALVFEPVKENEGKNSGTLKKEKK